MSPLSDDLPVSARSHVDSRRLPGLENIGERSTFVKPIVSISLSVGAVGAVVAGGLAVNSFLVGGGPQPEDVLPASTIGFVKVDLNPSMSQKLNVLRLMERFPEVDRKDDDLKRTVVESMLEESDLDLDYERDVEPWLGNRAAVAALPASSPDAGDPVVPVVVVEFTDDAKMTSALDEVEKRLGDEESFDYAVGEDFVFLGEDQAVVDAAASTTQHLADSESFAADKDAVDGSNQIVLGWMDVAAAYAAVPEKDKAELAEQLGSAEPAGRVVMGVRAESDAIEATGRTFDLEAGGSQALATGGRGTGLVLDLPASTDIAFSATGLGAVAAELWEKHGADPALGLEREARDMGLEMPGDLVALLGQEAALGVTLRDLDGPDDWAAVTARVATDGPDRALEVIDTLAATAPEDILTSPAPGGYVVGNDREHLADAANGDDSLADDPTFANAVPDADAAGALLFVDLRPVVELLSTWGEPVTPEEESGWDALEAFGVTATGDDGNGDGEFTMRLTFR
jgi:hypothetical protein